MKTKTIPSTNGYIVPQPQEQFTVETISPQLAKQYLATQNGNRKLNMDRVDAYAMDMLSDRWHIHGAAIQFDTNGNLFDGQHRLNAVIKADAPVKMLVARNINPDSRRVVDQGQKRSTHQSLQLAGLHVSTTEAAMIRTMMLSCESGSTRAMARYVSPEEMYNFADKYLEALRFAAKRYGNNRNSCMSAPIRSVIARAYLTEGVSLERLTNFLYRLDTGEPGNPETNDAVRLLRELYLASKNKRTNNQLELVQKTCQALKAFLEYRNIKGLKGITKDPFRTFSSEDFD